MRGSQSGSNSDAPPTYAKYADTLTCYLRVDGHILVNGRCRVGISGDTGLWTMKDDLAEAHLRRELPGRPYYARVKKRGKWVNYGPVDRVNLCFLNKLRRYQRQKPLNRIGDSSV